jgi:hypothetical protein
MHICQRNGQYTGMTISNTRSASRNRIVLSRSRLFAIARRRFSLGRLTPRKTKCDGGIERQEKDKRIRHKVTRDPSIAGAAVCLAKLHKHPLPFILIRAKHNRGKDPAWPGHDFNRQRTEPPRDRLQGIADCGHRDPRFGQQVGSCRRSAESSSLQPGPSSPDFSQRVDASGL